MLTRGYGGALAGPVAVDPARHNALDVGDEALLLARVAPTWVGADRRVIAHRAAEAGGTAADAVTMATSLTAGSVNLGAGSDSLALADGGNTVTVSNVEQVSGGSGADAVTLGAAVTGATITLGAGNDALTLANGTNSLTIGEIGRAHV